MGNDVTVPSSRQPIPPARGDESIDFIHREDRDAIHEHRDVGILRCTATFLRQIDFSVAVLRTRLGRSLVAKQLGGIIAFDAQLESPLLLKAIWLVDTQQWTEVVNALKLAEQRGFCTLPITMSLQDLQRHTTKQAYLAEPRVVALWKMIGRHVNFGGNYGRFELFDQQGGGVRAIKDEPGFELDINPPHPPIPPTHYQRQPARQVPNRPAGGQLDSGCWDDDNPPSEFRLLLLTSFDSPFVARVALGSRVDTNTGNKGIAADVNVVTTEPPVGGASDAFKDRRPTTAPLVRGLLSNTIAEMALTQQEEDDGEDDAAGDGDDDSDSDEDMDSNGNGEDDGQQEQQQEQEEDDEGVEEREAKRRRTAE
ncbi:unnamed protein product [Vitrella brassicaformis CCMP3155]|uniref:Uncharacterized protein n=1 Tax=Vitrella brassicaformis (strain CCMP3155) TaxID=1169540 RepID=A0A0G4ECD5_VITBC|nr:unnamed protein product [Vitrella brassicaformis CCMP3155]|eukprot:CEL93596.1 unnamed protein product [Vitrella brassicaformis CCMP3155]